MRVLLLVLILLPEAAWACDCEPPEPDEAAAAASAVFEGRVTSVEHGRITFEVVQGWRGAEHEQLVVTTPSGADCGIEPAPQTSWLVYASGDPLSTTICMRTRRIEDAASDLAALGAGVVPVDIGPEDEVEPPAVRAPRHAGCASCAASPPSPSPPALAFLLLAISSCRWRSRRAGA